jgi:hypothetical protein
VIFESKRKLQALVCEAQVTGSMFVSWQLYCSCPMQFGFSKGEMKPLHVSEDL